MKILNLLKKDKYLIILLILCFILFLTNASSNKYLLGLDNLQHEFNYFSAISRYVQSAWAEYHGLGLATGHANAVELLRLVLYLPFYLFLPIPLFRYIFLFSSLTIGVVSMYFLLSEMFYIKGKSIKNINLFSFFGAMFYLLNIGTLQNFFVALEPFSAFYAYFPLSILCVYKYLRKSNFKNYIYLFISQLLLTFAYQVQTFFVVYFISFILPLLFFWVYSLFAKNKYNTKGVFLALFTAFYLNLFWVLNVIYFYINSSSIRFVSKANKLSSLDIFLKNIKFVICGCSTGCLRDTIPYLRRGGVN